MIANVKLQNKKILLETDSPPKNAFLFSEVYFNNNRKVLLEFKPNLLKLLYVPNGYISDLTYLTNGPFSDRFLNASFLFYLYDNPGFIPNSWVEQISDYPKRVLFGGTIYSAYNEKYILLLEIWRNSIQIGYEDLFLSEKIDIPFAII